MSRVIAYDLCRLFIGPYFVTPRGIDRVDLAMANSLFADPESPHIGIVPTPLGVRAYPAPVARLLLDHLQHVWREGPGIADDDPLALLIADIRSRGGNSPALDCTLATRHARSAGVRRFLAMLCQTGVRTGHDAAKALPRDAVYVNLGQIGLAIPSFFRWLRGRPDVACAVMIHDTIPLDYPELVKPGAAAHHARMVQTAAAHADGLIFSTAFARTSVERAMERLDRSRRPSLVRSLPVSAAFTDARESLPDLSGTHYFVAVSTIEPRKNFSLLLRVWERLLATHGEHAPHLVIVGAPGLEADRILAPLTTSPGLRAHVHPVAGLSSPALARLMLGAAGLLSPSIAEGFGLPLLEGLALAVPTVASDIPSHREIGGPSTTLLAVDDQDGWERAIASLPRVGFRTCPPIPRSMTEAGYCADILAFLETLSPTSSRMRSAGDGGAL